MTNLEALTQLNLTVRMLRADLHDLPSYPLPAGFTLHWYEAGDGDQWTAIHRAAEKHLEIYPGMFEHEYGSDTNLLQRRLFFLRNEAGEFIATTAAWFVDGDQTSPVGLIHWVAIKPEYQGRGLGNCLMSIACERLRQLGHTAARLTTSTARLPAINLYLKFGFRPTALGDTGEDVWRAVMNSFAATPA